MAICVSCAADSELYRSQLQDGYDLRQQQSIENHLNALRTEKEQAQADSTTHRGAL